MSTSTPVRRHRQTAATAKMRTATSSSSQASLVMGDSFQSKKSQYIFNLIQLRRLKIHYEKIRRSSSSALKNDSSTSSICAISNNERNQRQIQLWNLKTPEGSFFLARRLKFEFLIAMKDVISRSSVGESNTGRNIEQAVLDLVALFNDHFSQSRILTSDIEKNFTEFLQLREKLEKIKSALLSKTISDFERNVKVIKQSFIAALTSDLSSHRSTNVALVNAAKTAVSGTISLENKLVNDFRNESTRNCQGFANKAFQAYEICQMTLRSKKSLQNIWDEENDKNGAI